MRLLISRCVKKNPTLYAWCLVFVISLFPVGVNGSDLPQFKGLSGETILGLGVLRNADYSPDGRYVATFSSIGAFLWDAESGKLLSALDDHSATAGSVKFSRKGRLFLAVNYGSCIKLWDVETLTVIGEIRDSAGIAVNVFSPDGKHIMTCSPTGTVKLWDIQTQATIREFSTVQHASSQVFSPDGTKIATMEYEGIAPYFEEYLGVIKIWNMAAGNLLKTITVPHIVSNGIFSPDGTLFLAIVGVFGHEFTLQEGLLLNCDTGDSIYRFSDMQYGFRPIGFSADGTQLFSVWEEMNLAAWDVKTGKMGRIYHLPYTPAFGGYLIGTVLPDKNHVLLINSFSTLITWNLNTMSMIQSFSGYSSLGPAVQYSPDGNSIATAGRTIYILDSKTFETIKTLDNNLISISSVVFSIDGNWLLSVGNDRTVKLWDVKTGNNLRVFGVVNSAAPIAISPDSHYALIGDYPVKLLDLDKGMIIRTYSESMGWVKSLAFSPDGSKALTGGGMPEGSMGVARLWDIKMETEIRSFPHSREVVSVAFSPDGSQILTGSWDGAAKIWDWKTGAEILTIEHPGAVYAANFSPDGKMIITVSDTARIWDAKTGKLIRTIPRNSNWIQTAVFSPDEKSVATGDLDGTVRIWDIHDLSTSGIVSYSWDLY